MAREPYLTWPGKPAVREELSGLSQLHRRFPVGLLSLDQEHPGCFFLPGVVLADQWDDRRPGKGEPDLAVFSDRQDTAC